MSARELNDPFTEAQVRQLHILRARGYVLTVVHRDDEKLQIGVAGRDASGARLVGKIDARGQLVAELVDFRPSKLAIGAPPEHQTVEEVAP